jgi:ribose 5-phosphate isomerase B
MRVAFGADDDNECVAHVLEALRARAHVEVITADAWPNFAKAVATAVANGEVDFGVLMCWTGTGTAIAANKVMGVRAVTAWDPWIAAKARAWNDANVLALSSKRTAPDVAVACVEAFFAAQIDPSEQANIDLL